MLIELVIKRMVNVLHSDSQRAIHLAKNLTFYSRTKHIALHYHFINSLLENGVSTLVKIQDSKNLANMLTKEGIIEKLVLCVALVSQK